MAATDPVSNINRTNIASSLNPLLKELGSLPPSIETPYLTASLDWTPDGNAPSSRSSITEAWNTLKVDLDAFPARSQGRASLETDLERITQFVREDLDPAARGVHFVANAGQEVFSATPLGLPIPTAVNVAPIPALKTLTRVIEDNPMYAILVMDQRDATLSFVTSGERSGSVSVAGSDYPRHQKSGGWSQKRFQTRADERVDAFGRTVADEVHRALKATGVNRLVFSSDEVSGPPFLRALPDETRSQIIGDFRIGVNAPLHEVVAAARPIAVDFERQREAEIVQSISDAVESGNRGVAGAEGVLSALRNGQVHELAMTGRYELAGWADFTASLYGAGDPPVDHPANGNAADMVPISLEEEMIRLAIASDSLIDIITGKLPVDEDEPVGTAGSAAPRAEAAERLDELGSVAALLRFDL